MRSRLGAPWKTTAILAAVLASVSLQQAYAQTAEGTLITHDGLAGTLLKPGGATTAALIIAGSGPTDRDGNSPAAKTDAYKQLAEGLAKANIASLRYDKRGMPQSRLDADGKPVKEENLTVQSYADDVAKLTVWLAGQGFERTVLIGHSEGALLALLAAKTAKADRLVLLSPAGYPLGQVLRKQFGRQPLPEDIVAEIERVLLALEKGSDPGTIKSPVDRIFRPSAQPFLKSVLNLDPAILAKGVTSRLMLVGGGNDQLVGRLDIEEIKTAKPTAQIHWEPRMTHVLKAVQDDDPGQEKVYSDPSIPIMIEVVDAVAKFALAPD